MPVPFLLGAAAVVGGLYGLKNTLMPVIIMTRQNG